MTPFCCHIIIVLLDSKDKIVATLAKPRRCIFPHFCSAVDLGEKKKSTTCSGESVIGALAKEIAVLVERAEANSADWSARYELIYSAARPSLPFPSAPLGVYGTVVAGQTTSSPNPSFKGRAKNHIITLNKVSVLTRMHNP